MNLKLKSYSLKLSAGQSILEVIVAMAIFSLIGAAMATLVVGGFTGLEQGGEHTQAEALAQEGIEAVKSIQAGAWNEIIYTQSGVATSSNQWIFSGEGTSETIGQFTRTISFNDVCRDGSDDITDCPGSYTDVQSKKASVSVSWEIRSGVTNSVQRAAYLTNWDSQEWTQTNWVGESGTNIDADTSGEIKLVSGDTQDDGFDFATAVSNDWPFTTPANYTYDSDKIEVTGGYAQLKASGGSSSSGDTLNPDFDTDTSNWTYNDWEEGGGADVTGTRVSTGGNPNEYANIDIPGKKNQTLSGYWEQSFTTTIDNPSVATVSFDWLVTQFSETLLSSYQLYVFVASTSGNPSVGDEVWSSGEISGTTSWASVSGIDISSKLGK